VAIGNYRLGPIDLNLGMVPARLVHLRTTSARRNDNATMSIGLFQPEYRSAKLLRPRNI
jgi:hypothetical protein